MGGGAGDVLDAELNARNHLVLGLNRDGNGSEVILVSPGGGEFGTREELARLNRLIGKLGICSTLVEVQDASHAIAMSVGAVAATTKLPRHPGVFGAEDNSRVLSDLPPHKSNS